MGEQPGGGRFRTTRWSVVLSAKSRDDAEARAALGALCQIYWYPLYGWFRRRGHGKDEAKDLTQEFFAGILARGDLARVERERGRFRCWLLASAKNFAANQHDRAQAQKRGGGDELVSFEAEDADRLYQHDAAQQLAPDVLFDRRWGLALLDRVLKKLRIAEAEQGKEKLFEDLKDFLVGEGSNAAYEALAVKHDSSPGAIKTHTSRLRGHYVELLKAEVADTVEHPGDVDDELEKLRASVRLPPKP